jgi:hypothetical protein
MKKPHRNQTPNNSVRPEKELQEMSARLEPFWI